MFPFLLSLPNDYSGDELTVELKARFKAGRWYLKQNTSFTQLSNCNIERSTFQIVGRGDARRQSTPANALFPFSAWSHTNLHVVPDKISLYVSKLLGCNNRYILEFRRSGRDVKESASWPCLASLRVRLANYGLLLQFPASFCK